MINAMRNLVLKLMLVAAAFVTIGAYEASACCHGGLWTHFCSRSFYSPCWLEPMCCKSVCYQSTCCAPYAIPYCGTAFVFAGIQQPVVASDGGSPGVIFNNNPVFNPVITVSPQFSGHVDIPQTGKPADASLRGKNDKLDTPGTRTPGSSGPADKKSSGAMVPNNNFAVDATANSRAEAGVGSLVVTVPEDAKVFINGRPTKSTGVRREYFSRSMKSGASYTVKVVAQVCRNGEWLQQSEEIVLRSGDARMLTFDLPCATDSEVALLLTP